MQTTKLAGGVLALMSLMLIAGSSTPQDPVVTDACGGGQIPRLDLCSLFITPEFDDPQDPEAGLLGVDVTLHVDNGLDDRQRTDLWAVRWSDAHGCRNVVMVHSDPLAPFEDSVARLNRFCEGEDPVRGELAAPTFTNRTIEVRVDVSDVNAVGGELARGTSLVAIDAISWIGQSTAAGPEALYTWDTAGGDASITLEPTPDG